MRVEVGTKLYAQGFQILNHLIARKMLCSVETHVFQEVGEAALALLFLNRPHTLHDVEIHPVLGMIVV